MRQQSWLGCNVSSNCSGIFGPSVSNLCSFVVKMSVLLITFPDDEPFIAALLFGLTLIRIAIRL